MQIYSDPITPLRRETFETTLPFGNRTSGLLQVVGNAKFELSQDLGLHKIQTMSESCSNKDGANRFKAKKKWQKLYNVFKGISLMKKNIVKTLKDPEDIVSNINNSPRRKVKIAHSVSAYSSFNATKLALDDVR